MSDSTAAVIFYICLALCYFIGAGLASIYRDLEYSKKLKYMQPKTSQDAYKKIKELGIDLVHQQKIIKALEVLGTATVDQIADYLTMDRHPIGRRMSELEANQIVYKPGSKFPNKKGNMCYQYCLVNFGPKVQHKSEKALPGKAVVDYAKELIKQPTLF
jgi:predicted transcriptional regulator